LSLTYKIFVAANVLAGVGWLMLLIPANRPVWFRRLADTVIPLVLSIGYVGAFMVAWPFPGGGFDSPENLARLFSQPQLAMTGWIHYLAFDLFIGGWQLRRAEAERIPYYLTAPCLVLTMIFGPIGLIAFFIVLTSFGNRPQLPVTGRPQMRQPTT